jgi:pyridoxamine 5'-phosphate oxidase
MVRWDLLNIIDDTKQNINDYRGGCLLIPHTFEFYQGQSNRLSDRIQFRRMSNNESDSNMSIDPIVTHRGSHGWIYERLSP